MIFLFANTLAISDASLIRYTFRCPDRHVLLKRADVPVASELTVWWKRFLWFIVLHGVLIWNWQRWQSQPSYLEKMIDVKCCVFKVSEYIICSSLSMFNIYFGCFICSNCLHDFRLCIRSMFSTLFLLTIRRRGIFMSCHKFKAPNSRNFSTIKKCDFILIMPLL